MINESYLKELIKERADIVEYAINNYDTLKNNSDNAQVRKFGTKCDGIGQFYLGTIMYRRDKGLKKGKFLKERIDNVNYTVYETDSCNLPLRIRKYNKFGCESNYYFFKKNNFYCCVPFLRDTDKEYGSDIYRYSFENGDLSEYAKIGKTTVTIEKYDYSHFSEGYYECNWYNYYNSEFSALSHENFDLVTFSLDERLKNKIRNPSSVEPIIRKSVCYYKIFLNESKIKKIEEYNVNNGEKKYIRTI